MLAVNVLCYYCRASSVVSYKREWVHSDTSMCEYDIYMWLLGDAIGCLFYGIEGQGYFSNMDLFKH